MNAKILSRLLTIALLAAAVTCGLSLPALAGPKEGKVVAFRDTAEGKVLVNAYLILATGDHDYKGHRVRAMHQVEAAADLLGMDVRGDAKDKQPQPLSDDKLREAEGMIQNVIGAASVKDQKRVVKHLEEAVAQINTALSIR